MVGGLVGFGLGSGSLSGKGIVLRRWRISFNVWYTLSWDDVSYLEQAERWLLEVLRFPGSRSLWWCRLQLLPR